MLRPCCKRSVVFTQGIPHLRAFADEFFLKTHPLHSSNIWLEENDFTFNQMRATRLGKPNPLCINSMSHHPVHSPYAARRSRPGPRRTPPLPSPRAGPDAPLPATPPRASRGGGEQSTGRPSPARPYGVPICSSHTYHHLYMFNLDQMAEDLYWGHAPPSFLSPPASCAGLRGLFPEPLSASPGFLSIHTQKPFAAGIQAKLQQLQDTHQYSSRWWGTLAQWQRMNAYPQPSQRPHLLFLKVYTKLVHISLIDNAEEILQRSFISARTGTFHCLYLREGEDNNTSDRAYGVSSAAHLQSGMPVGCTDRDAQGIASAGGLMQGATGNTTQAYYSDRFSSPGNDLFVSRIVQDIKIHKRSVPLYFSMAQLKRFKLKLRHDASGVSFAESGSLLPPSLRDVIQDGDENLFSVGASPATPLKLYFYHLSQVFFPESFRLPQCVVAAELEHAAGKPLHGLTGVPLPHVELLSENLLLRNPSLAAVLCTRDHGDLEATKDSIQGLSADALAGLLERRTSPAVHGGRSLWFSPEDILQHGGVVDVNATPAEVVCHGASAHASMSNDYSATQEGLKSFDMHKIDLKMSRMIFNVDCLVKPDEGFRVVNQKVPT